MIRLIDIPLLDEVSREARQSPRLRRNRNFHLHDEQPGHRLLNAVEPGSYIMPHRHLDPSKDETLVVLRGRMGLVIFDDAGAVVRRCLLGPGAEALGADLPHGTWHSLLAFESGTVFLEAKAGPYRPLSDAEKASWAPAEGAPEAAAYLLQLERSFG
jgi:cupin fold WbuC family metalloprotein